MIIFLRILMFVPWVLLVVFIVLAVVFAIRATPKKNQPVEEKHKAAKKKSNIFATISVFTIILGIVSSLYLNSYILRLEAKEMIDSQLFGDKSSLSDLSNSTNESINSNEAKYNELASGSSSSETSSYNKNTVLYDQNDILIEYKSWKVDRIGNIEVNLYIENNSENDFYVRTENFSAGDFQMVINGTWQVSAGKKLNDSITIYKSEIEKNGLSEITSIEFDFAISSTDYTIKYVTDTITLALE